MRVGSEKVGTRYEIGHQWRAVIAPNYHAVFIFKLLVGTLAPATNALMQGMR
jgi:hypothetical protein